MKNPNAATSSGSRYTRVAVVLHWLIAVLMIANVALVLSVDALGDAWVRPAIDTHKSIGITVLGLALLRILWRLSHPAPPFPTTYQRWERIVSHSVHGLLYLLMLGLPLSGWLHDSAWKDAAAHPMHLYGLVPWPRIAAIMQLDPVSKEHWHSVFGEWHESLGTILYVLVGLHVLGALKHQFIDKQPELQRMGF